MSIVEIVRAKVANLPAERQRDVLAYVEQLEQAAGPPPRTDPYGALRDRAADLTLDEFQQARRELWVNAPRDLPKD